MSKHVLRTFLLLTAISLLLVLTSGCSGISQTAKSLPVVVITAPGENATLPLGQTAAIQAVATHAEGVSRVELWVNGQQVQVEALPAPQTAYTASLQWTPPVEGTYSLEVRAFDAKDQSGSVAVHVTVAAAEAPTQTPDSAAPTATEAGDEPEPTATDVVDQLTEETEEAQETEEAAEERTATTEPGATLSPTDPAPTFTPLAPATAGPGAQSTATPSGPLPTSTPTQIPPLGVTLWVDHMTLGCDTPSTTLHWQVTGGLLKEMSLMSCSDEEAQANGRCTFSDRRKVTTREGTETISPPTTTSYFLLAQSYTGVGDEWIEEQGFVKVQVEPPTSPPVVTWQYGEIDKVENTGACQYAQANLGIMTCSTSMVYSPEGSEVAVLASDGVYVVSTDGSQVRQIITPPGFAPNGTITWSPRGEYIAYAYRDTGAGKSLVGVTRRHGTTPSDLWSIAPEGMADWPRWTTDQRLLLSSGLTTDQLNTVYVAWLSGPPAEIHPANRCERYELAPSAPRQAFMPWGPGRVWVGGSDSPYEHDSY
jgi:hypothetical protein